MSLLSYFSKRNRFKREVNTAIHKDGIGVGNVIFLVLQILAEAKELMNFEDIYLAARKLWPVGSPASIHLDGQGFCLGLSRLRDYHYISWEYSYYRITPRGRDALTLLLEDAPPEEDLPDGVSEAMRYDEENQ